MAKILFIIPEAGWIFDFPASSMKAVNRALEKASSKKGALGMPLHAQHESPVDVFNRFNHTIGSRGNSSKVRSHQPDGLVVKAVHFNNFRARESRKHAAAMDTNSMPRRFLLLSMVVVKLGSRDV
jgi:hypothetical protein